MTAAVSNTRLRQHMPGLLSLALASAVAVTTEMLPVGLLPSIGRTFPVADSVTGLLVSLYAVLVAALAVPLTAVTTRFSRKRLLMITLLCYAAGNALVAAAPTFAVVSVGRAIGGMTHAMFFSLCVGYTPRLVAAQQVGRALALTMGGTSAGFILGVPILTALGTACGWRAAFGTLALLTVLTLLLIARLLPAVGNEIPSRDAGTGHGRSVLAAVAVSNATTYLGQFTLYTFISVVLLAAGVRPAFVGPLLLACGLCGLVGLWYAGRTLDRNPRKTIVVILGIAIAAVLTLGAVFPALATTVVAVTVWNGAFGGALSVFQASAVRAGAASPEAAGAWVNAAANIGIAGGAAIGATALPLIGPSGLPWVTAALIGLGLAVALVARQAFPSRI